ncbi:MAG: hypothetical protein KC457_23660 [Myxococcales bacterium]|nr:hypothetical protein [Myxococcales bacterium]
MGLDSFKLHPRGGRAQLRFSDGEGRDLAGAELMPVVAFSSELVAEITRRHRGRLRDFCVDFERGVLRATLDGQTGEVETVQIEGREFEARVRPSSLALVEWAELNFEGGRARGGGHARRLEPDWS